MSQLTARFQNIYNIDRVHFTIIGCGAIGSYTAMALVRAGGRYFDLYDHDIVATVNIGVQHFNLNHVGKAKTRMLALQMNEINPRASIGYQSARYEPGMPYGRNKVYINSSRTDHAITIICVDSMDARAKVISKYFDDLALYMRRCYANPIYNQWLIDARMGSETFQANVFKYGSSQDAELSLFNDIFSEKVEELGSLEAAWNWYRDGSSYRWPRKDRDLKDDFITNSQKFSEVSVEKMKDEYMVTWYPDEDGDSEPCNARSTGYCASMSAAFINNQVRKIVDESSLYDNRLVFNFPSMSLVADMNKDRLML